MKKPLFSEVLRVSDGRFCRPGPHLERMAATMERFFGSRAGARLPDGVPAGMRTGIVKCRVLYDDAVRGVEFEPYTVRHIDSIAVVRADGLDYTYKYADRSELERLRTASGCDEVIIARDGYLTDTSFSNIVLGDASGLYTPDRPLLAGTRRAALLCSGRVTARPVRVEDLKHYTWLWLVNAMMGLDDGIRLPVDAIRI